MKARLLFLMLTAIMTAMVLIPSCSNAGQPVQAVTMPMESTDEAAVFSISNLTIRPADSSRQCDVYNLGTDDEIIVSVTVSNTSSSQGSYDVILYVDWVEVASRSVILAAGGSTEVEFSLLWGTNDDGIYTVTIGELQAIFGVG